MIYDGPMGPIPIAVSNGSNSCDLKKGHKTLMIVKLRANPHRVHGASHIYIEP